jgi:VWA domain-containing protein
MDNSGTEEDDYRTLKTNKRQSSTNSSYGASKSNNTALTDYTNLMRDAGPLSLHVPLDLVVVIPVSSSMQGLKITLLRDTLKFLVQNLGPRDRMGLVTFGSSGGGVPLVGMTTKAWNGWSKILNSLRPVGQKSLRADVVEGANVAMDLLMQRKSNNPISTILLISDSSTSESDSVDFVVSRGEAAKFVLSFFISFPELESGFADESFAGLAFIHLAWASHTNRTP